MKGVVLVARIFLLPRSKYMCFIKDMSRLNAAVMLLRCVRRFFPHSILRNLSCTDLAHHELESAVIIIDIVVIILRKIIKGCSFFSLL